MSGIRDFGSEISGLGNLRPGLGIPDPGTQSNGADPKLAGPFVVGVREFGPGRSGLCQLASRSAR